VDVLSGGRLNPGVSVGEPRNFEHFKNNLYPSSAEAEDFSYERVTRLLRAIEGQPVSTFHGVQGIETFSERVEPHSPGLRKRMWYGGASLGSARWAGLNGLNFLSSSVVRVENAEGEDVPNFAEIQRSHIDAFRAAHPMGRGPGLPRVWWSSQPTGPRAPKGQVPGLRRLAHAPNRVAAGPARMMFARDVIGNSQQIAEALYADSGFRKVREVVFALPFSFDHEDYVQIITDIAERLGRPWGGSRRLPRGEPRNEKAPRVKWSKQRSPGPATRIEFAFSAWEARRSGSGLN